MTPLRLARKTHAAAVVAHAQDGHAGCARHPGIASTRGVAVAGAPAIVLALLMLAGCGGGRTAADAPGVAGDAAFELAQSAAGRAAAMARDEADDLDADAPHRLPAFVGDVRVTHYDGTSDDLLTAGLGAAGLASAVPPAFADPLAPTAAELRRAAIYNNYRALNDMTAAGGYGTFFGPNVAADGTVTTGEGKVAGTEYLAYSVAADGSAAATLMVQIPDSFDPKRACLITATSSGSRGVYGAIGTGEWGLKRGCAVAYTDKGTLAAPHDLMNDTVPLIDGVRAPAADAGTAAAFRAALPPEQRAAFNAATPDRYAFKHAHSQRNPEKDWGRFTLQAIRFAFWAMNEQVAPPRHGKSRHKGRTLRPGNTLVIASSLSNGGNAALSAAEQDRWRLIDGVAVSEPSVELPKNPGVVVERGGVAVPKVAAPLYDYITLANLYQYCASQSAAVADAPGRAFVVAAFAANRCASLKAKGLLTADSFAGQADEALAKLRELGWEADSAPLHASHAAFEVPSAVAVTYANAYARASVADHLCGYSFSGLNALAQPAAVAPAALAGMFATGNGVPPSAGVALINNLNPAGPVRDVLSASPSSGLPDYNLDGAACLRELFTGSGARADAVRAGIDETRRNGNLRRKPALIVHGRSDALIPVNHSSRPYTALNARVEGRHSRLSYIEVTNAQHFDAFIGLPALLGGYDTRYIPLHVYLNRALDAMYEHLSQGKPLPPSQVVRTTPRGGVPGAAPALTAGQLPPIALRPAVGDRIVVQGNTLKVPD